MRIVPMIRIKPFYFPPSGSLRQPPLNTSLEQAVTTQNARLFLFVRNLLYLLVSFTSVLWLAGPDRVGVADGVVSP